MSAKEYVLVIPTERLRAAGLFQGFTSDVDRYLPLLTDPTALRFLPRDEAEADPEHKQLIPYVVLRHGGTVFAYTRGKKGGEARLHALRSLGIGGHINPVDGAMSAAYVVGMRRELIEEVDLGHEPPGEAFRLVGFINDDALPVGRVHLGVVHLLDLPGPTARPREEQLAEAGFVAIADALAERERFETWSRFLLEEFFTGESGV
jgi:predicted NUDIX family phosphoesterase